MIEKLLSKFWGEHPQGRVETAVINHKNGEVIVRAEVYAHKDDPKPSASGHAYARIENPSNTATSALEACEMCAIERALIIAGGGGSGITPKEVATEPDTQGQTAKDQLAPDPGEFEIHWRDYKGKLKDLPPRRILWLAAEYGGKDVEAKKAARAYLEQHPEILDKVGKSA